MVNGKVTAALKGEPSPFLCCNSNAERKSKIFFSITFFSVFLSTFATRLLWQEPSRRRRHTWAVHNLNGLDEVTLPSSLHNSDRSRVLKKKLLIFLPFFRFFFSIDETQLIKSKKKSNLVPLPLAQLSHPKESRLPSEMSEGCRVQKKNPSENEKSESGDEEGRKKIQLKKCRKKFALCTISSFFFSAHSNFLHFHSILLPASTAVHIVKMSWWLEDHDNNLSARFRPILHPPTEYCELAHAELHPSPRIFFNIKKCETTKMEFFLFFPSSSC